MNLKELAALRKSGNANAGARILIYGNPKTGKGTYAAMLAKSPNIDTILWFDFDKGAMVLLNPNLGLSEAELAKFQVFSTVDTEDTPYAIETAMNLFRGADVARKLCKAHGRFGCNLCKATDAFDTIPALTPRVGVVVDTLSALTDSAYNLATKNNTNPSNSYAVWGLQGEYLASMLQSLSNSKATVAAITHVAVGEDEATKLETIAPLCGTKTMSRKVGRYFDTVIYKEVSGAKFRAITNALSRKGLICGSRSGLDASSPNVDITSFL